MSETPHGAGKSSFGLVDADAFFEELGVAPGMTLVDMGAGRGAWTLAAWERMERSGLIWAVDAWEEGVAEIRRIAAAAGHDGLRPLHADASGPLPIADAGVDAVMMCTVLHDIAHGADPGPALDEIARITRPGGTFAVVEFKDVEPPPGPPRSVRISADELRSLVEPHGFSLRTTRDLGEVVYAGFFERN
jgi:ubiquinone/menaquinone biosynthesis C-methylase UbiE